MVKKTKMKINTISNIKIEGISFSLQLIYLVDILTENHFTSNWVSTCYYSRTGFILASFKIFK